jgi:hypothetical protein
MAPKREVSYQWWHSPRSGGGRRRCGCSPSTPVAAARPPRKTRIAGGGQGVGDLRPKRARITSARPVITPAEAIADPVGTVVSLVAAADPALGYHLIRRIIEHVGGRFKRRRLAAEMAGNPSVLTTGRSPASKVAGDLMLALRQAARPGSRLHGARTALTPSFVRDRSGQSRRQPRVRGTSTRPEFLPHASIAAAARPSGATVLASALRGAGSGLTRERHFLDIDERTCRELGKLRPGPG